MTPNISISLAVPSISIEKYSELTGLSIDTINDMLADGRLIRHRLRYDCRCALRLQRIHQLVRF